MNFQISIENGQKFDMLKMIAFGSKLWKMNLQVFSDIFGNGKVLFYAFLVRELNFYDV